MFTFSEYLARHRVSAQAAFTRAELVAMLAALALLAVVVLPALASSGARGQRLTCLSNLREIGQSFTSWSSDFGNRLPIQVDYTEGGARNHPSGLQNNAWFHFAVISNNVRTPRIFACPSDPARRQASDFNIDSAGGFIHPNYQNRALSYILSHPFLEARPDILAGDRHLAGGYTTGGGCLYYGVLQIIPRYSASSARWTETNHSYSGNALFSDGRVEQLSTQGLRQRLAEGASESNNDFHYLAP